MQFDVLVCGPTFADLIYAGIPKMPGPGEEVYAKRFTLTAGGAYITAVAAARLGLRVGLITTLGQDLLSGFIRNLLQQEGLSTALIHEMPKAAFNVTVAMNQGGDRSFLSYSEGMNQTRFLAHARQMLELHEASWLHLSAQEHTFSLAQRAREKEMLLSLDLGWDEVWLRNPKLLSLIGLGSLFVPNTKEALYITKTQNLQAAMTVLSQYVPRLVIKKGAEGALVKETGLSVVEVMAPMVEQIQDTTGAGDNLVAGILYGLIRGYSLQEAAAMGTYCGSASVQGLGGTANSLYEAELRRQFRNKR